VLRGYRSQSSREGDGLGNSDGKWECGRGVVADSNSDGGADHDRDSNVAGDTNAQTPDGVPSIEVTK